jgi:cold shock protein
MSRISAGTTALIHSHIYIMNGTIKKLTDKNFGFIKQDGSSQDVFFHASEVQGSGFDQLAEGDAVTFDMEDTPKGPKAVNVTKA